MALYSLLMFRYESTQLIYLFDVSTVCPHEDARATRQMQYQ